MTRIWQTLLRGITTRVPPDAPEALLPGGDPSSLRLTDNVRHDLLVA